MSKKVTLNRECLNMYLDYKWFCKVVYDGVDDRRRMIDKMSFKNLEKYSHELMRIVSKGGNCARTRAKFMEKCVPENARNANHAFEVERAETFTTLGKEILKDIQEEINSRISKMKEQQTTTPFNVLKSQLRTSETGQNTAQSSSTTQWIAHKPQSKTPLPQSRKDDEDLIKEFQSDDARHYLHIAEMFYQHVVDIVGQMNKKLNSNPEFNNEDNINSFTITMTELYIERTMFVQTFITQRTPTIIELDHILEKDFRGIFRGVNKQIVETQRMFRTMSNLTSSITFPDKKKNAFMLRCVILYACLMQKDDDQIKMVLEDFNGYLRNFIKNGASLKVIPCCLAKYFLDGFKHDYDEEKHRSSHVIQKVMITRFIDGLRRILTNDFFLRSTPKKHIDICIYLYVKFISDTLFDDIYTIQQPNIKELSFLMGKEIVPVVTSYVVFFIHNLAMYLTGTSGVPSKFPEKTVILVS
jgi:hypothetical protein